MVGVTLSSNHRLHFAAILWEGGRGRQAKLRLKYLPQHSIWDHLGGPWHGNTIASWKKSRGRKMAAGNFAAQVSILIVCPHQTADVYSRYKWENHFRFDSGFFAFSRIKYLSLHESSLFSSFQTELLLDGLIPHGGLRGRDNIMASWVGFLFVSFFHFSHLNYRKTYSFKYTF